MKFKHQFPIFLLFLILSNTRSETTQFAAKANSLEEQECDIVLEHGLCLYNGDKCIFEDAKPEGLVGHWTFDDYRGLDSSGNHNHAASPINPGPAMGGVGSSAAVGGSSYIEIAPSSSFDSNVFSITFWVFLVKEAEEAQSKFCPLIYKGNENIDTKEYARSPAILVDKKDRTIQVAVTTNTHDASTEGESITSKSKIPYSRWSHIAVVRQDKKLKLYVNGILDSVLQTQGSSVPNHYPLYIGNTPFTEKECNLPAYIDELRFYVKDLNEQEIEAEASPALGNMYPSFVHLGCINCVINQAAASCIEGYHLCSTVELHAGVFQIAKSLGWTTYNIKIWSYAATKQPSEDPEALGLGICCVD